MQRGDPEEPFRVPSFVCPAPERLLQRPFRRRRLSGSEDGDERKSHRPGHEAFGDRGASSRPRTDGAIGAGPESADPTEPVPTASVHPGIGRLRGMKAMPINSPAL